MSRQFVEVLNPRGQRYLSLKRADHFVRRGFAVINPEGKLCFRDDAQLALSRLQMKRENDAVMYERMLAGERGGQLQGEWYPVACDPSEIEGAPEFRTVQFVPAVVKEAEKN
jgi:hypothetical protein